MQATNRKAAVQQAASRASGGAATRIKMLDAALDIMIEEGIRAVRHRAVAKRAGVSLGSTTYHFGNIEDIIISAFEYWRSKALLTDSPFYRQTTVLLAPYSGGAHLHRRIEIGPDTAEIIAAERFVTGTFDRIVTCTRGRFGRRVLPVKRLVMVTQAQGETVGKSARLAHLFGRQVA
ncbi:MAG: TetR family transcriptional regulator [Halioglobus sp.]|nr:TetR family transcriptional regulator [Halioglobus sp.]